MDLKVRSNSALVTDACAAALSAFYSAAQRGRYTALTGAACER
jgi:hypothetical protein